MRIPSLVPDAAVTHEYWYLEQLCLDGAYYQIKSKRQTTRLAGSAHL